MRIKKPSRLEVEMAYNEGMWQEGFFSFGSHPPIPARKPKRGRRSKLTLAQQQERKREYHKRYYLTVTKPKRRRLSHGSSD